MRMQALRFRTYAPTHLRTYPPTHLRTCIHASNIGQPLSDKTGKPVKDSATKTARAVVEIQVTGWSTSAPGLQPCAAYPTVVSPVAGAAAVGARAVLLRHWRGAPSRRCVCLFVCLFV
jgi:hypothetical protein